MSRGGIQEPFWVHATRKAGVGRGNASTSTQNTEDLQVITKQPTTTTEPKPYTPRNVPPCAYYKERESSTSDVQERSLKRLKTQLGTEEETPNFKPPENPCFLSSADVGRTWHHMRRNDRRHRNRSIPFKIVSYNVLADSLLYSHPMLYEELPGWCLEWEYRKKNLLKEILHYNADILCLQEIEEQHYENWFKPELEKVGYQGTYKKRTGKKVDGCATFYKESKFGLLTHQFYDYKKEDVPVMDRDNVAILTLLHPRYRDGRKCNSTALCVVNTHLLFNKNRGDIKLLQLACLFAEIDKLKKEFFAHKGVPKTRNSIKKIPVVLSGDFNTTPFCPLYNFIVKGFLNYEGMSKRALSGQNQSHHFMHYRERDVIRGNIVPLELGLSHLSVWDIEPVQNQEDKPSTASPPTNVDFAADDFGASNSDWQEFNGNFAGKQNVPSTSFSAAFQQEGTKAIPPLLPDCKPSMHSGHRVSPFDPRFRYQVPPEPLKPKYNPLCTIIKHNLYFYSAYRHYLQNRASEVTTYHDKEPSCTVDYFFIAPGREFVCGSCGQRHAVMELTSKLNLLSGEQIAMQGGLPNQKLSSDHLALVAGFVLHL